MLKKLIYILSPISSFLYLAAFALFLQLIPALPALWHGDGGVNAVKKCRQAIVSDNGTDAVTWAQKFAEQSPNNVLIPTMKAYSFELVGDYDRALNLYFDVYYVWLDRQLPSARIAYKKGEFQEAFIHYSKWVEHKTIGSDPQDLARVRLQFYQKITGEIEEEVALSPFNDYSVFLSFAEKEFASIEEPEKYEKSMEFFREVDREKKQLEERTRRSEKAKLLIQKRKNSQTEA